MPGIILALLKAPCQKIQVNFTDRVWSLAFVLLLLLACDAAESNKLILVIPLGSAPESMTHDFAASSVKITIIYHKICH
jgi:hypothetical protein